MSGSATLASPQTTPPIEEAEGDPDVLGGGAEHLGRPPHRVVEVHPLVPDRVPDGVGDRLDVPVAVVEQDHIEVAVGAQRAPPVAADGQEGQVAAGCRRPPDRPIRRATRRPRRRRPGRIPRPAARLSQETGAADHGVTYRRPWRERSIGVVSKDVKPGSGSKTPMTFTHAVAMTVVAVVGVLVAFWISEQPGRHLLLLREDHRRRRRHRRGVLAGLPSSAH